MTPRDDLATLRKALALHKSMAASGESASTRSVAALEDALAAHKRVEAELARLEAAAKRADAAYQEAELIAHATTTRAEAAEQREASLREALEQRRHVVTSQSSPGDPVGHDGFECDPDCDACAFAREVARLREERDDARAMTRIANSRAAELREGLRGLDETFQWLAEHYPKALREMPTELFRRFTVARSLLADNQGDKTPAPRRSESPTSSGASGEGNEPGLGAGMTPHDDLATLRRIAEAADAEGRPWEWEHAYPQRVTRVGDVILVADCYEDPDAPSRFAEFIATFDPPTVLALLDRLEQS